MIQHNGFTIGIAGAEGSFSEEAAHFYCRRIF